MLFYRSYSKGGSPCGQAEFIKLKQHEKKKEALNNYEKKRREGNKNKWENILVDVQNCLLPYIPIDLCRC